MPRRRLAALVLALLLTPAFVVLALPPAPGTDAAPGDPIVPTEGRRTISGDFDTACVILTTGEVDCWGEGGDGQIGDGASIDRPRPSSVTGLTDVIDISVGDDTTCAVDDSHVLWCWGSDSNGELGNGPGGADSPVPVPVPGMSGTRDVSAGYDHVCAAKIDGTAWCWGEADGNELANGSPEDEESPFQIPGITDAIATAVSEQGSCVLHADGTVSCWGNNNSGEVGNGTFDLTETPVKVPGVTGAIDIEKTDDYVTCALIDDGTVTCWGDPSADWLDRTATPTTLPGITDAIGLRLTARTICVVRADFGVACAGETATRLPGDLPTSGATVADTVLSSVADVSLGRDFGCAISDAGTVTCWGDNGPSGRLGVGSPTVIDPVRVPEIEDVTSLDAGHDTTCAIPDGELWCWGSNEDRLIADSDADVIAEPTRVGTASNLVDVTVGRSHACTLDEGGNVACWGSNFAGQLGLGDTMDRATPVQLAGKYIAVSAGRNHTCAIDDDDAARCWGTNDSGELGNGSVGGPDVSTPTLIDAPAVDFTSIDAGDDHTCGTQANDRVRCWGLGDDGQLGDGLATTSGATVLVDDLGADFEIVAAGVEATCATRAGNISCWGQSRTVAGASSSLQQDTPQDKAIGGNWSAIDMENEHACAIRTSDLAVHCWGSASNKRLTDLGSSVTVTEPTAAIGVGKALDVTTGDAHSCALLADGGEVWCWGDNDNAQAGDVSSFESPEPVEIGGLATVAVEPEPSPTTAVTTPTTTTTTEATTTTAEAPSTPTTPTTAESTTTTAPMATTTTTTPVPAPAAEPIDVFSPVPPARLLDTRTAPGAVTIDGEQQGIGRLAAGDQIVVDVAGRAGVDAGARAAIVNITAIGPGNVGFVTAHPCLDPRPLSSSLNYSTGVTLGNEVVAELSEAGTMCIFTSAATHLAVDVVAYLPSGSDYSAVGPTRLADTRTNGAAETADGRFEADGLRRAGTTYRVEIAGRGGVSSNAVAAVMNVTAIAPSTIGFLTLHPCAATPPNTAGLNYSPSTNRGNEIIAPLSGDGEVCVFTSADTHLSIDVVGEITGDSYTAIEPLRFVDTRTVGETVDGMVQATGRIEPGGTLVVPVAGRDIVPDDARTVTLNVTSIQPSDVGFITAHPCLDELPTAASLNYVPGVNGGNEILAQLDGDGAVCFFSSASTHLTVDIAGYTT